MTKFMMKSYEGMAKAVLENITIHDVLEAINKNYGDITALQMREKDGSYRKISYVELGRRAIDISSALIEFGIQKDDRVVIFSESRPEWAIAGFGIISCGAIIVPIDVKLSEKEIQFILEDSQAKCVFVSEKYLATIDNLKTALTHIKNIIVFDDVSNSDVILFKSLKIREGQKKYNPIYPEDTALIVYTSGTAGVAKGVELSYKNLLFQVLAMIGIAHYNKEEQFLSILPLNHMLEITGGLIAPLYIGACVTYCDTLKTTTLTEVMKETHTTVMVCVPLVLKMFHEGIMKHVKELSPIKQKIFRGLLALSKLLLKFNIRAGKAFFPSVHRGFGLRLRVLLSGGAPLDMEVELDLNALGFIVLQGYGLTETSPVISVNTYKHNKVGTVGIPLEGAKVKILNGQILTRGPHVMKGYYKNPEKTAEVIKDGWFYTGDTGYFDKDGFLHISGRLRNLIVLGAGKKVFPEEVEEVIGKSSYIKEICVLGKTATHGLRKGHEEVYAVVVPNLDIFGQDEKSNEQKIKERISSEIKRLSENLAEYKRIMDFEIWREGLPKTTSKKIKRKVLADIVKNKSLQVIIILVSALSIQGCVTTRPRNAVPMDFSGKVTIPGMPDIRSNMGDLNPIVMRKSLVDSFKQEGKDDYPVNSFGIKIYPVLAISGGGPNGAYGAGFLIGWSKEGSRPLFKIITGVSSGSLIALYTFLGKDYDDQLEIFFTTRSTKDLMKRNNLLSVLFGDSLMSSALLVKNISAIVDDKLIVKVAQEHRRGRRLFIGTVNFDAQEFVVWDMGALACKGGPDALNLFRKIILASSAMPMMFPPVYFEVSSPTGKIYDEMHVDGGAMRGVFYIDRLTKNMEGAAKVVGINPSEYRPQIYILSNAYMSPIRQQIKNSFKDIGIRFLDTLGAAANNGDIYRLYAFAQKRGLDFNLAYIPDDFSPQQKEYFDTKEMRRLFKRGYDDAVNGYKWHKTPPEYEAEDKSLEKN